MPLRLRFFSHCFIPTTHGQCAPGTLLDAGWTVCVREQPCLPSLPGPAGGAGWGTIPRSHDLMSPQCVLPCHLRYSLLFPGVPDVRSVLLWLTGSVLQPCALLRGICGAVRSELEESNIHLNVALLVPPIARALVGALSHSVWGTCQALPMRMEALSTPLTPVIILSYIKWIIKPRWPTVSLE